MAAKESNPPGSKSAAQPGDPIDLSTSVAGEEDPGASVDMDRTRGTDGRKDQPAGQVSKQPSNAQAQMAPGDEAPAGTPSTGEAVCPQCGGSGRMGASSCPNCLGTGKVIVGIGGA